MGCCGSKKTISQLALEGTSPESRATHPLSKQNNPEGLTVLRTPTTVKHWRVYFKNRQGLKISVQCWAPGESKQAAEQADKPADKQGAIVVCLHGLNTHLGYTFADVDYMYPESMLDYYNRGGHTVYAIDHQGHGDSEGVKPRTEYGHVGYVRSFDDIAMDVWQLIEEVVAVKHPGVPVILHGHCMGGAHTLRMLQLKMTDRPPCLKGAILSAPSYVVNKEAKPNALVMNALALLAKVSPGTVVADWPDRNDSDLDTRFYNDPFCTPTPFSAHYANQLNKLYNRLAKCHTALTLPILVMQGEEDTYVLPEDTKTLFEKAPSPSKTLVDITDMNHGLLHEPGCQTLFTHVVNWIDSVVAASAPGGPELPKKHIDTIVAQTAADKEAGESKAEVGATPAAAAAAPAGGSATAPAPLARAGSLLAWGSSRNLRAAAASGKSPRRSPRKPKGNQVAPL